MSGNIVGIGPSGGNDTTAIQNNLNTTASNLDLLQLLPGNYTVNPLFFPTNAYLQVQAGVTVHINPAAFPSGSGGPAMLNIVGNNVNIIGLKLPPDPTASVFTMAAGTFTSEFNHCLNINSGGTSIISGLTASTVSFNNAGGDGVYMLTADSCLIDDCICASNRRNGASVTGRVSNSGFTNCQFTMATGTPPQAGIDIEPNTPADYVTNFQIAGCDSSHNLGDGVRISLQNLTSASQPVSIYVSSHTALNNGSAANQGFANYLALNNDPSNAAGFVLFQDCISNSSAYWGAVARNWAANGANLIFNNLTVTNPQMLGPDPVFHNSAAVAVIRGGSASTIQAGNVRFLNCNINVNNGKVTNYFDFFDQSPGHTGPINVQFVPGTLTGATNATVALPGTWNGGPLRAAIN